MTKGSYAVGNGSDNSPRKDNSFRSFICILLIFLAICLIILLATLINWSKSDSEPDRKKDEVEVLGREGQKFNKTSDRIISKTLTTTTSTTTTTAETTTKTRSTISNVYATNSFIEKLTTATSRLIKDSTLSSQISSNRIYNTTSGDITSTTLSSTSSQKESGKEIVSGVSPETSTIQPEETRRTTEGKKETLIITKQTLFPSTQSKEIYTIENITGRETSKIYSSTSAEQTTVSTTGTVSSSTKYIKSNIKGDETTDESSSTSAEDGKNATNESSSFSDGSEKKYTVNNITEDTVTEKVSSTSTEEAEITHKESSPSLKNITENAVTENVSNTTTEETNATSKIVSSVTESVSKYIKKNVTEETVTEDIANTSTESEATVQNHSSKLSLESSVTPMTSSSKFVSKRTSSETTQMLVTETPTAVSNSSETTQLRLIPLLPPPIHSRNRSKVCYRSVCNETAARMLTLMNHSAIACEDFYDFACGGVYGSNEEADHSEEFLEQLEYLSEKHFMDFKLFYKTCLEYENDFNYRLRIQKVDELLKSVGRFQFQNLEYSLTDLLSQLILRQSMPLFDVSVDVDKQSSNLILQLTLPEQSFLKTRLKDWSSLSVHKKRCLSKQKSAIRGTYVNLDAVHDSYKECYNDYGNYINSVSHVLEQLEAFSELPPNQTSVEIQQIRFHLERYILDVQSKSLQPNEILSNFTNKKYDVRKVSDLQVQYPVVDWRKLFGTLVGRQVLENSTVQVYYGKYLNEIFINLQKFDKRLLNNVLLSIFAHDLYINTVIPKETSSRDRYCFELSKKLMPDVWASLVKSRVSPREQKYQSEMISGLFKTLKNNFCTSLGNAAWIDDDGKIEFLDKCGDLSLALFTPPDKNSLTDNYQNVNMTQDYQTDLIALLTNFRKNIYSTVGQTFSDKIIFSYFLDPMSRKALSSYATDVIAVPLGLINRAPAGLPNYLIMSRVGLNLARQMVRHFDPTGMSYWITLPEQTQSIYSSFITTMQSRMEYSSPRMFLHKNVSFQAKDSLSLNERVVDSAAFRLILDSFLSQKAEDKLPWISSSYTNMKIFFIAVAQEFCQKTSLLDFMLEVSEGRHLPAVLRVDNIMMNSETFSETFECGPGSGMNPQGEKLEFPYIANNTGDSVYYDEPNNSTLA